MASPVEHKLPQRTGTVSSSFTRRTSFSDDEAIPDTDSSEVRLGYPGDPRCLGYEGQPRDGSVQSANTLLPLSRLATS